jgi:hypothetical protein
MHRTCGDLDDARGEHFVLEVVKGPLFDVARVTQGSSIAAGGSVGGCSDTAARRAAARWLPRSWSSGGAAGVALMPDEGEGRRALVSCLSRGRGAREAARGESAVVVGQVAVPSGGVMAVRCVAGSRGEAGIR